MKKKSYGAAKSTLFFPQVAIGGGYSTLFTVTNTGLAEASANLTFTDQGGDPFRVNGELSDPSSATQSVSSDSRTQAVAPSFFLSVPAGGTVFLRANPLNPGDPTKTGWARLDSLGGSLTAVGTFQYVSGGTVQTIAGVLQSRPVQFATIPVDNDDTQDQFTGYAFANPGNESITVKLALVDQNGAVVDDTVTIILNPGQQRARFLHQDLDRLKFRGSMVLRAQGGKTFVVVALLQKQNRLTVIPVIAKKAPGVPN